MPILDITTKAGQGDVAITDIVSPSLEAFRQALRKRLIASRGSTYTYRDPDATAGRAGGSIDDDGTIRLNIDRPSPSTAVDDISFGSEGRGINLPTLRVK